MHGGFARQALKVARLFFGVPGFHCHVLANGIVFLLSLLRQTHLKPVTLVGIQRFPGQELVRLRLGSSNGLGWNVRG